MSFKSLKLYLHIALYWLSNREISEEKILVLMRFFNSSNLSMMIFVFSATSLIFIWLASMRAFNSLICNVFSLLISSSKIGFENVRR